ncbi:LOW QUALITY PROTEIN: chitinase-like protein Idgf1 [Drosophila ficusphila]|uniref:LOW QUALITY PROTEIN: chitinase-like protein Idgf1 n=1 Tax=Drosophila ficusphila TaxID=30025 RepID=UPI0007E7FDC3|nr:LOW QUALITY PROTEIN: chitinase-like protein Idgf1 [Drosophila ficusphila]
MKFHLFYLLGLLSVISFADSASNLICYYDSTSFLRDGLAKMHTYELELALSFCTHLVYGYAGLKAGTHELFSLNVDLDMFYYKDITALRQKFPQLKILLSVGGDHDVDEAHPNKYIELLEANRTAQQNFIDSSMILLKRNGFDGLDLAFQFPRNKPRKVHGAIGTYWKSFKKLFTGDFIVDPQSEVHKSQFTDLAGNIRNAFRSANLMLSLTVLPNVNSTWYFDIPKLHPHFDYINLALFDFYTPLRNPEEADFTAPLFLQDEQNRLPHLNVDFQVNYWLQYHCPPQKLNLGIASYGRAWKMTSDSGLSGLPIVHDTFGAAPGGNQIGSTEGLFSWPEICSKLSQNSSAPFRGDKAPLRKVTDLTQKYGNYALRPADEKGDYGVWLSFDDPDFAGIKAGYAKGKGLGGIAVFDLSYDDFRGQCTGQKYPILRSIKYFMG